MSHPEPAPILTGSVNIHPGTVKGFGDEWSRFTQDDLSPSAREQIFQDYFRVFPWHKIPENGVGADIGCGSGRWAQLVAPRVGILHVIDASADALAVARVNLSEFKNINFFQASVDCLPLTDSCLDFAYSLGVLHHVPDTAEAIKDVAKKLKPGAPLLLYLYYAFDNKSRVYWAVWKISDWVRKCVCRLPLSLRYWVSQILAFTVYWPLARTAAILNRLDLLPEGWPLSYYRDKPLYVLRTDALDRFGTRLEQRFTKKQIAVMMTEAGLRDILFSESEPFWCAVGLKEA